MTRSQSLHSGTNPVHRHGPAWSGVNVRNVDRTEDQPFVFLFGAEQPALVGSGSCFECGDWSSLYYDVTRRKLYWEYEGD